MSKRILILQKELPVHSEADPEGEPEMQLKEVRRHTVDLARVPDFVVADGCGYAVIDVGPEIAVYEQCEILILPNNETKIIT